MTIFSDAAEDLFSDDDLITDATYTPDGDSGVSVSVIQMPSEEGVSIFESGATITTMIVDMYAPTMTDLQDTWTESDTLTIGSDVYYLKRVERNDATLPVFTLTLKS